jgi:hypothetical protein
MNIQEDVPKMPAQEKEDEKLVLKLTGLTCSKDLTILTKLNLPKCVLSTLPDNLATLLPNLSILFLPKNLFEELPSVVGSCSKLQVITKINLKVPIAILLFL